MRRRFASFASLVLVSPVALAQAEQPYVGIERIVVSSTSHAALARRVIARNLPMLRFCYEQGLSQAPDLHGRIVVRFDVSTDGTVPSASATRGAPGVFDRVAECAEHAVQRWQFPSGAEPWRIELTVRMRMGDPAVRRPRGNGLVGR